MARALKYALAMALAAIAVYVIVDIVHSPYGSEQIYRTGDTRDIYWKPPAVDHTVPSHAWVTPGATPAFVFEKPDAPGLAEIREQILPVITDVRTDLERAVAIRLWLRQQVGYGWVPTGPSPTSLAANEILVNARKILCDRLAVLLITAYTAAGLPARMVHLSTGGGRGHFVTEVWLWDQERWVMMDPSLNYYAAVDRIPASAMDIYLAVRQGGKVEFRRDGATTSPDPSGRPFSRNYETLDYFRSFSVVNRNDFLAHRGKIDDYLLLVWEEGAGPAHPARSEILRLFGKASAGLIASMGCLAILVLLRRPPPVPPGVGG